jgi:Matrixin
MKATLSSLAAATLMTSSMAHAQIIVDNSLWKYTGKTSTPVKMYVNFPSKCRPALARAVATLNAAATVKFKFTHSQTTTSTNNLETAKDSDLVVTYFSGIDPGTPGQDVLAIADPVRSSSSTSSVYGPGYLVSDTDIKVDYANLFYVTSTTNSAGDFFCPAAANQPVESGKLDFETVILHELGHAYGLSHFTNSACVMYAAVTRGVAQRTFCPAGTTPASELVRIGNLY